MVDDCDWGPWRARFALLPKRLDDGGFAWLRRYEVRTREVPSIYGMFVFTQTRRVK